MNYASSNVANDATTQARLSALGARTVGLATFDRIGRATRLVSVAPASAASVVATLRNMPSVQNVQAVRRAFTMTRPPTFTNDPYFYESSTANAPTYTQTATTPGQWDMHVMQLENAYSYSEGSTSVKLAIIDTGEDVTHPDLAGSTVDRSECFITDENDVQSTGTYVTDPDGHGTDVTGIAAADTNNGYGFAGAGGNVGLMLYRIFPTPDDSCTSDTSTDPRCGATDFDIATAVDDAVANGAQVINLSLGIGQTCTNGVDPDTTEGNAINNAIAHNVIVVAASGNDNPKVTGVSAPGCDSGVIAVGATGWNDGVANGSGYTGTNSEYVTSYSQFGSPDTYQSSSSWGIVAPGGDGASQNDTDTLHWVENIWTTTPYDSTFAGACGTDFFGETGNCRTLIAGTSMATAHVSGVAALVLSVNASTYGSPTAMKNLLCSTADNIGDPNEGCGRVNAYRAVATAFGDPNP